MRLVKFILIILIASTTFNCGLQPIYNKNTKKDGTSYEYKLAAVQIVKHRKRIYQKLNNNLEEVLNPNKIEIKKEYLLNIILKEHTSTTFISPTGSSGRNKVILQARYTLKRISDDEIIAKGNTAAKDDFDVEDKRFANYIAEEEIKLNLTRLIAQNIRDSLINDLFGNPSLNTHQNLDPIFEEDNPRNREEWY